MTVDTLPELVEGPIGQTFPEPVEGPTDRRFDPSTGSGQAKLSERGLRGRVWEALGTVVDPELDEPITDLGFVPECSVDGGAVRVRLRLPTAFCSPSFAYLMASDAYDAATAVPGVERVVLTLDDHSDSAAINAGVAAERGFAQAFPAETNSELHELRRIFQRKAHQAWVERACTAMLADGWAAEDLYRLTLGDLSAGRLYDGLTKRRTDLGLPVTDDARVCADEAGVPWPPDQLARRLRFAKSVRVSIDGNAHFCRGLLQTRYPGAADDQSERAHESLTELGHGRDLIPLTPVRSAR